MSPEIVATDASSFSVAGVKTVISENMASEMWRHRDRKGARTFLPPRMAEIALQEEPEDEILGGIGLLDDDAADDDDIPMSSGPGLALPDTYDFVELWCGPSDFLLRAMTTEGFRCGPRIDPQSQSLWDLLQSRVIEWCFYLVDRRRVRFLYVGMPSASFSVARFPKVRSFDAPWGSGVPSKAVLADNRRLLLSILLLRKASQTDSFNFVFAQPTT